MENNLGKPPERLLFSEYVFEQNRQSYKLSRLKVQLNVRTHTDGKKVFNLDVKGVKAASHIRADFTPQDLCFMRLDEFQSHEESNRGLCSCFGRNYYPAIVYTRLLLLLYSVPETGELARCIRLPLLQPGNRHAATTLLRLQDCIHQNVVAPDELKHWSVRVVSCGSRNMGEVVQLGLTKYALLIIQAHMILHYHPFYASQIEVTSESLPNSNSGNVEITVYDKSWHDNTTVHRNFSLSRKYVFRTSQWQVIERSIRDLVINSQQSSQGPSAHFNIQHSETSASVVPGSTSDNVMVLSHIFEIDNSGSSSSNGNVPRETHFPQPHLHHSQYSSSSNGCIPRTQTVSVETHQTDSGPSLHERGTAHSNVIDGVKGGKAKRKSSVNKDKNIPILHKLSLDYSSTTPKQVVPVLSRDSDPATAVGSRWPPSSKSPSDGGIDNPGFVLHIEEVTPAFAEGPELDLPPPPPCSAFSEPHAEFSTPLHPPRQCVRQDDSTQDRRQSHMLRSNSFMFLNEESILMLDHSYVNMVQELSSKCSVHDDSVYFRYYYNIGFIKAVYSRMSKKLRRRHRLSKKIGTVDFNKLENHERWYDRDYKIRAQDEKFCKLINKKPEEIEGTKSLIEMPGYGSFTAVKEIAHKSLTAWKSPRNSSITALKSSRNSSITNVKSVKNSLETDLETVEDSSMTELKLADRNSVTELKQNANSCEAKANDLDLNIKLDDCGYGNVSKDKADVNGSQAVSQSGADNPPSNETTEDSQDDPYWANDLCITIQEILQEAPRETTLRNKLLDKFDLSATQLSQLEVLLSLLPAENNWKILAEYVGMTHMEVSIIEHFVYTYRVLAAKVVLVHWVLSYSVGKIPLECNFENLELFLEEHGREDVLRILRTDRCNENVDNSREIVASTYL